VDVLDVCSSGVFENLGMCIMWVLTFKIWGVLRTWVYVPRVCLKFCNLGGLGNLDICITLWVCLTFVNQGVLGTRVYISHGGCA
jgi:hypothetical protein